MGLIISVAVPGLIVSGGRPGLVISDDSQRAGGLGVRCPGLGVSGASPGLGFPGCPRPNRQGGGSGAAEVEHGLDGRELRGELGADPVDRAAVHVELLRDLLEEI